MKRYIVYAGKNITRDMIKVPEHVKEFEFINHPYMEDGKAILIDTNYFSKYTPLTSRPLA